ncbi:hypothetical protein [Amycolatopsis sp. NPDC058986]|uniref:hypothetical protein n=1 Tax=unclassified Amycolatopsis TaxID=2618356 RepID=UPI0036718600
MRISTDDEVYNVPSVWLGPPEITFPWRARYVSYLIFGALFLPVFAVIKALFGLGFFSIAWSILITVVLTRILAKRIATERPLSAVALMSVHELTAPRQKTKTEGGAVATTSVTIRETHRPRRRSSPQSGPARGRAAATGAREVPRA